MNESENFDTIEQKTPSLSAIIGKEDINFQSEGEENKESTNSNDNKKNCEKQIDLGKFKDTQSLLQAYNSLQAEFTKRSQKLSEMEKRLNCDNEKVEKSTASPQYLQGDWEEKLGQFLLNNPTAKNYAPQISEILLTNDEIASSEDALEKAWAKVCLATFKTPDEIISDKQMLSQIISNEEVKEKVIEEYLTNLSQKRTVPLITKKVGTGPIVATPPKPQSLDEAKDLCTKLFF